MEHSQCWAARPAAAGRDARRPSAGGGAAEGRAAVTAPPCSHLQHACCKQQLATRQLSCRSAALLSDTQGRHGKSASKTIADTEHGACCHTARVSITPFQSALRRQNAAPSARPACRTACQRCQYQNNCSQGLVQQHKQMRQACCAADKWMWQLLIPCGLVASRLPDAWLWAAVRDRVLRVGGRGGGGGGAMGECCC